MIGEAIQRSLAFAEVKPEQMRSAMFAQGLPEEIPIRLLGLLADYALKPEPTTFEVEKLLDRPRTLSRTGPRIAPLLSVTEN